MQDLLVSRGIIFCIVGTLLSGIVGLGGSTSFWHRASQALLVLSNVIGILAAVSFFSSGADTLPLFRLPFLFHTTFVLDKLSGLFFLMTTTVTSLVGLFALRYVEGYRESYNIRALDMTAALFIFGMQTVLLTTNIAAFMLCWEVMSVASFFLVMTDREEASMKAAFLYLTMTQLGASALIAGFFLLSHGSGLVDFATIASTARMLPASTIVFAFALLFFGFGSKAGLVPFHLWLPEAHPRAPSHISALMSGIMLKIALYGFLRVVLFLLPPLPAAAGLVVLTIGLLSGLFGVLHAVVDRDIKRTLAFSSIENLGLIFAMIGLGMYANSIGLDALAGIAVAAALFHSANHALFKSGLFLCAGAIVQETHTHRLEAMGGLAKAMPLLTGAFCLLALAASALPPFGTFFGEWTFLEAIIGALPKSPLPTKGILLITLSGVVLVSGLAIFAMVKLFAIASLGLPRSVAASHAKEPTVWINAPILIFVALSLLAGISSSYMLHALSPALIGFLPARASSMTVATGRLSPPALFLLLLIVLVLTVMVTRLCGNRLRRSSHVWDCGQPVDASMEYTATAFSSPIRFFFRFLLHHRKTVTSVPLVANNPWIAKHSMSVNADSVWFDTLYGWIASLLLWLSTQAKRLQNGIIQFYLLLIFLTLVLSLLVAV
ncbi:MAG: proton-conducting transporter membrane subunit [Candidatus Peregrinibacteria bacterium]|nr:proton-conducting transporter membrane subunit [Candidatus Peregrinibacteria bacterium]